MIKYIFVISILASISVFSVAGFAAEKEVVSHRVFDVNRGSGAIEFEAIGRPGALKIHGKGAAPHGILDI